MKGSMLVKHLAKTFEALGVTAMLFATSHVLFSSKPSFGAEALFATGLLIEIVGRILAWLYVGRRPLY